ncbi:MAG: nucleotide pyrophosphohydrolase [Desulfobulbus sp.]|nr:MAG: nucleotide pyrophosphohydrolase [Desulfobulbus sp.]
MPDSIQNLMKSIDRFADERNWEQFHSPKNLAMALIVEAGELVEHFQWLDQTQSRKLDPKKRHDVSLEMADVLIYLVRMANRLDIDLLAAANEKIMLNGKKYPVQTAAGRADKHTTCGTDP